jgi:hypothetical protein
MPTRISDPHEPVSLRHTHNDRSRIKNFRSPYAQQLLTLDSHSKYQWRQESPLPKRVLPQDLADHTNSTTRPLCRSCGPAEKQSLRHLDSRTGLRKQSPVKDVPHLQPQHHLHQQLHLLDGQRIHSTNAFSWFAESPGKVIVVSHCITDGLGTRRIRRHRTWPHFTHRLFSSSLHIFSSPRILGVGRRSAYICLFDFSL